MDNANDIIGQITQRLVNCNPIDLSRGAPPLQKIPFWKEKVDRCITFTIGVTVPLFEMANQSGPPTLIETSFRCESITVYHNGLFTFNMGADPKSREYNSTTWEGWTIFAHIAPVFLEHLDFFLQQRQRMNANFTTWAVIDVLDRK